MKDHERAKELGLYKNINRRDFINGSLKAAAGIAMGGIGQAVSAETGVVAAAASESFSAAAQPQGSYPPALTGMRGSGYPAAYGVGHSLRDGTFGIDESSIIDTGEEMDLVVVGAGLSGLAASYYFRKERGAERKQLLLDNHDDFGGHAKRNEFSYGGRTMISNAGTFDLATDGSEIVANLLEELEFPDFPELNVKTVDRGFYARHGMGQSIYFDESTFGTDKLVRDPSAWTEYKPLYEPNMPENEEALWRDFMREAPLSEKAKQDIHRLYKEKIEYFVDSTPAARERLLRKMTYKQFLEDVAKCDPEVLVFLRDRTFGSARGISGMSAWAARRRGMPGFLGVQVEPRNQLRPPESGPFVERSYSDKYHFPDGNATLARVLVRTLVPGSIPGTTVEDSITAKVDYEALDHPESPVKIRLSSTVVRVENKDGMVEVIYACDGKLYRVYGKHCVLACWHSVIPYICPSLPSWQKEALSYAVKAPNVWVNVWLRNWKAFEQAGACFINAPNGYFSQMILEHPIDIGGFHHAKTPNQPTKLTMLRGYEYPGLTVKEQYRAGRAELYATDFEKFEYELRNQLSRMLGPYGFDAATDIVGITINRWGHGYCYMYSDVFDEFIDRGEQPPHQRARERFDRIVIANTDAAGVGSTSCAIDQAHRAVSEIMAYHASSIFY